MPWKQWDTEGTGDLDQDYSWRKGRDRPPLQNEVVDGANVPQSQVLDDRQAAPWPNVWPSNVNPDNFDVRTGKALSEPNLDGDG